VETTAKNIDKTARTVYEMAEAQRDSFEAIAENFSAAQRRSMGLAEGGLEFMRLQEENARAAQEFFARGVKLLQLQQRNAQFVQDWTNDAVEVVREQAEHNARTAETFARTVGKQQEAYGSLAQGWFGAYSDFFSPFAYMHRGMKAFQQSMEATEQVARQGLRATEQATKQGLRVAEEATERTENVLRQTEKATREAELRTAVFSALGTADYDALTVAEISERIEGLPAEQLRQVREFEKNNKNRETLIAQIDRKIRANS
jgi:hypothetical protein